MRSQQSSVCTLKTIEFQSWSLKMQQVPCIERRRSWRGRDNAMNSYETEEIAEITAKWSAFHLCQVHRQLFFVVVYVRYKDLWISFLSTGQTTDNRRQTTDGQTQILNPALGMRARGKKWKEFIKSSVWLASWSDCECLWGCWSTRTAGWKVNGIHKFPGQGTLERWLFGILGPAHFHAS